MFKTWCFKTPKIVNMHSVYETNKVAIVNKPPVKIQLLFLNRKHSGTISNAYY